LKAQPGGGLIEFEISAPALQRLPLSRPLAPNCQRCAGEIARVWGWGKRDFGAIPRTKRSMILADRDRFRRMQARFPALHDVHKPIRLAVRL
jgi:hypothetical protein